MADIAQIEFMKPNSFTVGSDVYKGTGTIRVTKNGQRYYRPIPEGSLTPSRSEPIENDQPPVTFEIQSKSLQLLNLTDTQAASCTVAGVDAMTGTAVTVTLTNPSFGSSNAGGSQTQPGPFSISGEATDVAFT